MIWISSIISVCLTTIVLINVFIWMRFVRRDISNQLSDMQAIIFSLFDRINTLSCQNQKITDQRKVKK